MRRLTNLIFSLIICSAALALQCTMHYHLGVLADLRVTNPGAILGGDAWNIASWVLLLLLLVLEISLVVLLVQRGKKGESR